MNRRTFSMLLALLLCLTIAAGWSWSQLASERRGASQAATDAATSASLAQDIETLRTARTVAGTSPIQQHELAGRIEAAAQAAGLPQEKLVSITPEAPRRLRDSPYLEVVTKIHLLDVPLTGLADFLHRVAAGPGELDVTQLRIVAPRTMDNPMHWNAEASLSYLVFSPIDPQD